MTRPLIPLAGLLIGAVLGFMPFALAEVIHHTGNNPFATSDPIGSAQHAAASEVSGGMGERG